jgi:hypothetical protein
VLNVHAASSDPVAWITRADNAAGISSTLRLGNNDATYKNSSPFVRGLTEGGINQYNLTFGTSNGGDATERVRIDSSGNLLVGTTTATGSISNTAPVVAGVFKTISGTVSAATATYTTIATLGNITNATYIVSCGIAAGDPTNYSAVSIVSQDGTTLRHTSLQTAALMTIRISGQDIQALQATGIGTPIPIYFTITRVS